MFDLFIVRCNSRLVYTHCLFLFSTLNHKLFGTAVQLGQYEKNKIQNIAEITSDN